MKKMLGVLLVGGAVVGVYLARKQIQAFVYDVRDRFLENLLELGLDDSEEDEPVEDVVAAFEAGEKSHTAPVDEYVVKYRESGKGPWAEQS